MGYQPRIDDVITLQLPDEMTRARIERLYSKTPGLARLEHYTTNSKSHSYRKGDLVPCRYGRAKMGLNGWTAISEKELEDAAVPEEVPHESSGREMTYGDIFGVPERKAKASNDAAPSGV